MNEYAILSVGFQSVGFFEESVPPEILAVFVNDMIQLKGVHFLDFEAMREIGETAESEEWFAGYVGEGRKIADRLDALGFTAETTRDLIKKAITAKYHASARTAAQLTLFEDEAGEASRAASARTAKRLKGFETDDWLREMRNAISTSDTGDHVALDAGTASMLLEILTSSEEVLDVRFLLRAALLAAPEENVELDITQIATRRNEIEIDACSKALASLHGGVSRQAPIVVLTEGSTDKAVLSSALQVIYPHLTDLIRFMDYSGKPQGGAGNLVNTIKAFAAAGIANRVLALFDNDTAAKDALRGLDVNRLPSNIRVQRYPDIRIADRYPTLGPPTESLPEGGVTFANINGLACSIELYLGRDILEKGAGKLQPVQWRSYMDGAGQYQGEIMGKSQILDAFRKKADAAMLNQSFVDSEQWADLRAILDTILPAFSSSGV